MSLESSVGREFLNIMEVVKSNVVAELVSSSNDIELTPDQLVSIRAVIERTVDTTGDRCVDALTKIVRKG